MFERLLIAAVAACLAACQAAPVRTAPPAAPQAPIAPAVVPDAAPVRVPAPAPKPPRPTEPAPEPTDLWQAMRDGFALPGCEYAPRTDHWARRYAASPRRFSATLEQFLPALDYVHRQVQAMGLPSEFALLPIVESQYRPYPGSQAQPAGIWQIVGSTGRHAGLRIDGWIDERLNFAASTRAALELLDRYGERFDDDWRMAMVAYNAGEHRARRAVEKREPGPDFADLQALEIPRTSLEYLTKLLALACLVREPERFDLDLPALEPERRFDAIEVDGTIGTSLARALSGMPDEKFDRFNAGLQRGRTPPGTGFVLLASADAAERARQVLSELPSDRRIGWHRRALAGDESLEQIAHAHGLDTDTLLALNGLDHAGPAASGNGARLWLPGSAQANVDTAPAPDDVHVVRSGDSLWAIARRHGLTVADLLRYNGLTHSRIKPGQRLRLNAPDSH